MLENNLFQDSITDPVIVGQLIPQKAPFEMVDKLIYWGEDRLIGGLCVKEDNLFTEASYFTEPGLIEHMAQCVAMHRGYSYYVKQEAAPVGYLGSIKRVEINRLPKIGEELVTNVEVLHELMGVTMVRMTCKVQDELIASAEMKTVIAKE